MRLLIFRHGDPDYAIDGLTDKGKVEAELLARQIRSFGIDEAYVSPLGRARATADYSLKELGMDAKVLEWLQEFPAQFDPNKADRETRNAYKNELKAGDDGTYGKRIVWDMMPSYFAGHSELFDVKGWRDSKLSRASNMVEIYDHVTECFDRFLQDHGYERAGENTCIFLPFWNNKCFIIEALECVSICSAAVPCHCSNISYGDCDRREGKRNRGV